MDIKKVIRHRSSLGKASPTASHWAFERHGYIECGVTSTA